MPGSRDVTGRLLRVGDWVRVIGTPDLSDWSEEMRAESEPVFEHLVGTYRRIKDFNELGFVELFFRIQKGKHAGLHAVWLEPELVRVRRSRKASAAESADGEVAEGDHQAEDQSIG